MIRPGVQVHDDSGRKPRASGDDPQGRGVLDQSEL